MPVGSSPQLFLATRWRLARERLLQVRVHAFIRIEIGAVGRQVVHLDLRTVRLQPVPHQTGAVGLEPVHDEEDLAPGLSDQALDSQPAYQSLITVVSAVLSPALRSSH